MSANLTQSTFTESIPQSESMRVQIDHRPSTTSTFHLDVNLELPSTGVTVIYGASGSGKTTLLRCIAGLERAARAEICVANQLWQSRGYFLETHKRSLGFVFQEASLFPFMSVRKNLLLAIGDLSTTEKLRFFDEVVSLMGIDNQLERKPNQLSGGERQRVAIARALLLKPSILLFDEPLASLDSARKNEILPYLDKLQSATNTPILYVTHSDDEVLRLANYLVVLEHGLCKGAGIINEVASDINLPFSGFFDRSSIIEARMVEREELWGLVQVEFEGGTLWLPDSLQEIGSLIRLRIKASDVSIALTDHQDSSILNRLEATIEEIQREEESSVSIVKLRVGEATLLAKVSNWSLERLSLKAGLSVWAQLKAVAIAR